MIDEQSHLSSKPLDTLRNMLSPTTNRIVVGNR